MRHRFQRASLAPDGFALDSVKIVDEVVHILLRSRSPAAACPDCGRPSRRVQSRYLRRPADLPLGGRRVKLTVLARRFWCDAVLCGRRIFCEQFKDGALARYGRRTQRLETIVHHLGLALGGRPAAAFANRLMVPVSNDTLLRVVRRRIVEPNDELSVIGIDDFAFRRGQTYGTIVCDLERRRPVTLLPDRALDTSRAWLAAHPSISTVARDRGGGYGEAIAKALPDADQVADRWHLMENSSRAFLDAVGKSMRQVRQAVGSNVVDPSFSPMPNGCNTKGICVARKRMRRSGSCQRRERPFAKLFGKPVIAGSLCAMSCGASASMCSGRDRARWIAGCLGSMAGGKKVHGTLWLSGERCGRRALLAKAVSSRSGPNADAWQRRPTRVGLHGRRPRGSLPA